MLIKRYSLELVKEPGVRYDDSNAKFSDPQSVHRMATSVFHADRLPEEHAWVVLLNNKLRLIGVSEVSKGTYNRTLVEPKDVLTRVLMSGATGFILVHNHPSGDPSPSTEDFENAEKLKLAADIVGVCMLDSIIVGDEAFVSLGSM